MAKRRKYIEIKIYVVYMWFSLRYLENNFIHFSNTNRCLLQWGFFWMYCVPFQNFSTLIRRFKNIRPLYIVLIKMMESADIKRQDFYGKDKVHQQMPDPPICKYNWLCMQCTLLRRKKFARFFSSLFR